jgi:asparagine synthase (glutamine-hydrolysing)
VQAILDQYGPDGKSSYTRDGISIVYRAFHTTKESREESQPHVSISGSVITWDGRLDNRTELIRQFGDTVSSDSSDILIVAAAYERWGTDSLGKLIGDWALSIWKPGERSLILAKDPIGTRQLYYAVDKNGITWCTILDPLVLLAGKAFTLNEEYIAGWFSLFPAAHLTPYVGVHSVPPSSFVRLDSRRKTVTRYWDFDPDRKIRYRSDAEYEEQFRTVFAESVRRRVRADAPILAELSGGMDSSSIVCMADALIASRGTEAPQLHTLSYYNESEPNWNERPYFTKVEEKRGMTGCHIDLNLQDPFRFGFDNTRFALTPGCSGHSSEVTKQFIACLISKGHRVLLSGIGGDEVLGGVPTALPELADLFARAKFRVLGHQLVAWSLAKRKPAVHLLFNSLRVFFPAFLVGTPEYKRSPSWLCPRFVRRHRAALNGYASRLKLFGPLPSFQDGGSTLDVLRRQLGSAELASDPPYEKRYPYLDRDLLEFAYAIPREQLARPGQRRSLMRRALIGIVPDEILQRKRKAFVDREPLARIRSEWDALSELVQHSVANSLQIIDSRALFDVLHEAKEGKHSATPQLMRTLAIEAWLRHASRWNVIHDLTHESGEPHVAPVPQQT